jgi:segregation and condensation protein A
MVGEEAALPEMAVLAVVEGQPMTVLPEDLFIPPDALTVLLDAFSGPLDLLCYLIRRQHIDIMNIPMTLITKQYLEYIQLMQAHRIELAAEYLVMAAMLAEIKSRLLLPSTAIEAEEEDPRTVLVRKLQAYEQMRETVQYLDALPRCERDIFRVKVAAVIVKEERLPDVELLWLTEKMNALLRQQSHMEHHQISQEPLSVRERMIFILTQLQDKKQICFHEMWTRQEGRAGLVVTFLAVLELTRQALIQLIQNTAFSPIYLLAIENA